MVKPSGLTIVVVFTPFISSFKTSKGKRNFFDAMQFNHVLLMQNSSEILFNCLRQTYYTIFTNGFVFISSPMVVLSP